MVVNRSKNNEMKEKKKGIHDGVPIAVPELSSYEYAMTRCVKTKLRSSSKAWLSGKSLVDISVIGKIVWGKIAIFDAI